jgi:hypothetical protein
MIAIGHVGDADTLPAGLRDRERQSRVRKPLGECVYGAAWGEPADLFS